MNQDQNMAFSREGGHDAAQGGVVRAEIAKIPTLRTLLDLRAEVAQYKTDGSDKAKSQRRIERLMERINTDEKISVLREFGITEFGSDDQTTLDRASTIISSFESGNAVRHERSVIDVTTTTLEQSLAEKLLPIFANTFDYNQSKRGTRLAEGIKEAIDNLRDVCSRHIVIISLACGFDKLTSAELEEVWKQFATKSVLQEQGWKRQTGLSGDRQKEKFINDVISESRKKFDKVIKYDVEKSHVASIEETPSSVIAPQSSEQVSSKDKDISRYHMPLIPLYLQKEKGEQEKKRLIEEEKKRHMIDKDEPVKERFESSWMQRIIEVAIGVPYGSILRADSFEKQKMRAELVKAIVSGKSKTEVNEEIEKCDAEYLADTLYQILSCDLEEAKQYSEDMSSLIPEEKLPIFAQALKEELIHITPILCDKILEGIKEAEEYTAKLIAKRDAEYLAKKQKRVPEGSPRSPEAKMARHSTDKDHTK